MAARARSVRDRVAKLGHHRLALGGAAGDPVLDALRARHALRRTGAPADPVQPATRVDHQRCTSERVGHPSPEFLPRRRVSERRSPQQSLQWPGIVEAQTQTELAVRSKQIEALRAFLASGEGGDALGEEHCIGAGRSHIYAATIYYPPTIKELIATGRILLIRDPQIKEAILSFDQAHEDLSQLRTDIQIDRRVLARHYPELIDSGMSTDWSGAVCDFEGMRADQAFRNEFTDNMRRYRAYAAEVGQRQVETLEALAAALSRGTPDYAQHTSAKAAPAPSTNEEKAAP